MPNKLARLGRIQWLLVFEAARMAHGHLMDVTSPQDRRKVQDILKRTKGMPQNLTERDKAELKRIAGKLDLGRLARDLGPSLLRGRGRRRS